MRAILSSDPFADLPEDASRRWNERGRWPARWIASPRAPSPPHVVAYKRSFLASAPVRVRIHVSADERYELFLDGVRIGRGPLRGSARRWYYESYDLDLDAGEHVLAARVFTLGPALAPAAQVGIATGFLLCADPGSPLSNELSTGIAPWHAATLGGLTMDAPHWSRAASGDTTLDGRAFPWGCERGLGDAWEPASSGPSAVSAVTMVEIGADEHPLYPSPLPPMLSRARGAGRVRHVSAADDAAAFLPETHLSEQADAWEGLAAGRTVRLPARARVRVLFDLEDYVCAYPEITTSGGAGARITLAWAEALADGDKRKRHRDEIDGLYLVGPSDTFVLDGGDRRTYEPWWWRCGRYVALTVVTADEPLTVEAVALRETRYPLQMQSELETNDTRLGKVFDLCVRALEVCCHETYQDCPLYEQQQWVGDTRTQMLCGYVLWRDDRAARNAIELVAASRGSGGLTAAYHPARTHLVIPAFSLWWIASVYDLALYRGARDLVERVMPEVRASLDVVLGRSRPDGLITSPPGWCFNDWAQGWPMGVAPDGDTVSGLFAWQLAMVLGMVAELERWLGEPELAARAARRGGELARAATTAFWDEERGLFADDLGRRHFSEHTQAMAVLSGVLDAGVADGLGRALASPSGLVRARMFFSHWVFEALVRLRRIDAVFERLSTWHGFVEQGLRTTPEHDEQTRSDCHAWSAHPLYHFVTGIAGVRPAAFGFRAVRVEPQLGPLDRVRARVVHPDGFVEVDLRREGDALRGTIALPDGVTGTLVREGREQPLVPGANAV